MGKKGWKKFISMSVLGVLVILLVSCASVQRLYHQSFMKGSILEKEDSTVYLCIGKNDGAKVGQELDVYKVKVITIPKQATRTERNLVGKVKITEVLDEHFARAIVVSGSVEKNDIAAIGW